MTKILIRNCESGIQPQAQAGDLGIERNLQGGRRMNKIVIVAGCALGLALAWIPAYASPTSKKVTITCNSATGVLVTGTADVYLCSSIDSSATVTFDECVGA